MVATTKPKPAKGKPKNRKEREHTPPDKAYASIKVFLHHPDVGGSAKDGWEELNKAYRTVNAGIQKGMGDFLLAIRDNHEDHRTERMSTQERKEWDERRKAAKKAWEAGKSKREKEGFNHHLYRPDLPNGVRDPYLMSSVGAGNILYNALRHMGVSSQIAAQTSESIAKNEFSNQKLGEVLRGERGYPHIGKPRIYVHNTCWSIEFREKPVKNSKGEQGTLTVPVIKIYGTSKFGIRDNGPPIELECKRINPKKGGSKIAIIDKMAKAGLKGTKVEDDKGGIWAKGALAIYKKQEPGHQPEWCIDIAYASPAADRGKSDSVVALHRGIHNAITMVAFDGHEIYFKNISGQDIVNKKSQFFNRRKRQQRSLRSLPNRGRGVRHAYAPLRRIQDAERRYIDTQIKEIAKEVQLFTARHGASVIYTDDFGAFKSDVADDTGRFVPPYLRRFPFANVLSEIISVCTRRAGVTVRKMPSGYIAQQCPSCGFTDEANINNSTKVREKGSFICQDCGLTMELDSISAINLMISGVREFEGKKSDEGDDKVSEITEFLGKKAFYMRKGK